jgi:tetratricopeptide (TPR) repeat protein
VPFDSVFAETMLEADYEMKVVSMLGRNVPFGGFRSVIQHIRSRGAIENSYSRFWFTPAPPAPGDILTTPDGAVYLYDGGVILDTEEMVVSAGALSGTGGRNPINETVARNFTEIYGEFEGAFPVFRRLHAVMDMSLTAALWRTTRLAHPVLRRLAALKVPPHPVRRSYKALFHQFSLRRGRALLAGGVNLAQQLVAGSVHAVDDRVVGVLLGAARRTRGVLSTRVEQVSLPVIPGRRRAGDAGDDPILRVNVILQSGDAERAYALADRLARRQPDRADLMALRVEAAIELGLYRLAEHDLRRIFQLTNAAEAVRQTAIRVRILEGRLTDFSRLSRADRRAVAGYFRTRGARLSVDAARRAEALEQAEIAVRLAPRVAENLAVRGSILLGMGRLSDAGADLEDAIRFKPRNAMFRILGARVALDTGEFAAAEQHLTVAIENATGLDVLKYITMRGIARGCIGADLATCKSIIRSVEQIAGPDPPKKPAPPDRARSRRR